MVTDAFTDPATLTDFDDTFVTVRIAGLDLSYRTVMVEVDGRPWIYIDLTQDDVWACADTHPAIPARLRTRWAAEAVAHWAAFDTANDRRLQLAAYRPGPTS